MEHGGRWRRNASRLVWTLDLSFVSRGKATREGAVLCLAYRYVWRGDLFDTFDESVRVWTSVGPSQFDQSMCHVRATDLLSPTL